MKTVIPSTNELTLRGVVLGLLITVLFTAANVYFGLKAGLTFATSIPAAVISMGLLRYARGVTIQENNIVQTVASAAGAISSIIFVLPGLVMVGWWSGFPYVTCVVICAMGGVLGVTYSIPLRRALVTTSDLPYPEGVACAEVLKVGAGGEGAAAENRAGLLAIVWGAIVSAVFQVVVATQLFAADVVGYFRLSRSSGRGTGRVDHLPVRPLHRRVVRYGRVRVVVPSWTNSKTILMDVRTKEDLQALKADVQKTSAAQ